MEPGRFMAALRHATDHAIDALVNRACLTLILINNYLAFFYKEVDKYVHA